MVQLSEKHFFNEGVFQKCYEHPDDLSLCIKINKAAPKGTRLYNELNYYKRISRKNFKNFDYPFITKYYGQIQTNLGAGNVFDLVRDEISQEISKTMEYYLMVPSPEITDDMIIEGFERLKYQMIRHKIIANDLRSKNICCKILKNKTIELIIVDGVGHRDFFPFVDYFSYFAKKKIDRRLTKMKFDSLEEQRAFILEVEGDKYSLNE